jgi:two-component system cell cycle response regulator
MTPTIRDNMLSGWTVLVVDDEPDSIQVLELLLARYGAQVFTAKNGSEGLTLARQQQPRLIITDLSMPQVSGWEMFETLQHDVAMRQIPVIALTAHAMAGDREKVLRAGFAYYLTKPLRPKSFIGELMAILRQIPQLAAFLEGDL